MVILPTVMKELQMVFTVTVVEIFKLMCRKIISASRAVAHEALIATFRLNKKFLNLKILYRGFEHPQR